MCLLFCGRHIFLLVLLFLKFFLIPVYAVISANHTGIKRCTIIFLIMLCRLKYAFRTYENNGNVEVHDQNISQIRERPKVSKLQPCKVAKDSKCSHKQGDAAHNVDADCVFPDTVCCDFGETDQSQKAGKSKQSEA